MAHHQCYIGRWDKVAPRKKNILLLLCSHCPVMGMLSNNGEGIVATEDTWNNLGVGRRGGCPFQRRGSSACAQLGSTCECWPWLLCLPRHKMSPSHFVFCSLQQKGLWEPVGVQERKGFCGLHSSLITKLSQVWKGVGRDCGSSCLPHYVSLVTAGSHSSCLPFPNTSNLGLLEKWMPKNTHRFSLLNKVSGDRNWIIGHLGRPISLWVSESPTLGL